MVLAPSMLSIRHSGFIVSYARPGGNITGTFLDSPDVAVKWMEALKEAVPRLASVSVLWDPATGGSQRQAVEAVAPGFGIRLDIQEVRELADVGAAFQSADRKQSGALLILSSPLVGAQTKLFAELAAKHQLPAITLFSDFARNGGLMSYGPILSTFYRHDSDVPRRPRNVRYRGHIGSEILTASISHFDPTETLPFQPRPRPGPYDLRAPWGVAGFFRTSDPANRFTSEYTFVVEWKLGSQTEAFVEYFADVPDGVGPASSLMQ